MTVFFSTIIPKEKGSASANIVFNYVKEAALTQECSLILLVEKEVAIGTVGDNLPGVEIRIIKFNSNGSRKYFSSQLEKYLSSKEMLSNIFVFDFLAYLVVSKIIKISKIENSVLWLGDTKFELDYFNAFEHLREVNLVKFASKLLHCSVNYLRYIYAINQFKKTVVCSRYSERRLRFFNQQVDFAQFKYFDDVSHFHKHPLKSKNKVLFFGNLQGLGSRSALECLLNDIAPKLAEKEPGIKIVISGREPPTRKNCLRISNHENIEYVGFISDMGELFESCFSAILPIEVAIGNRTRALTCLEAAIPIIITHEVKNGTDIFEENSNCLVASKHEFVEKIIELKSNSNLRVQLSENGFSTYMSKVRPSWLA